MTLYDVGNLAVAILLSVASICAAIIGADLAKRQFSQKTQEVKE